MHLGDIVFHVEMIQVTYSFTHYHQNFYYFCYITQDKYSS